MRKLLVIIPAYNEASSITSVVTDVQEVLAQLDNYHSNILIINDASEDITGSICKQRGWNIINHIINLGIGGARQVGYQYAKRYDYDFVAQIDGDGQHNPADIPYLLKALEEKSADIIVGSRFVGVKQNYTPPVLRRLGMFFSQMLLFLSANININDTTSEFRVINRKVIDSFSKAYPQMFTGVISLALAARLGFRIIEMPASFHYRKNGKSSINWLKSIYYPFKISLAILGVIIGKK